MSGTAGSHSYPYLTAETAKVILNDLLVALTSPETSVKLEEARDSAGNDMLKTMQYVFPIAAETQMDVIKNYGFTRDGKGATQFTLAVKALEKDDAEVAGLNAKVRSYFIPAMISVHQSALPETEQ